VADAVVNGGWIGAGKKREEKKANAPELESVGAITPLRSSSSTERGNPRKIRRPVVEFLFLFFILLSAAS